MQIEGDMLRKVDNAKGGDETKLKIYTYRLIGKELYVYRKNAEAHKSMHSLVGVFLRDANEEIFDCQTLLYSFKLFFPNNTVRQYYFDSKLKKVKWMTAIKEVIGQTSVFDYYDFTKETLG